MNPTPENLAQIRVLYRQPDTLALWGIPYDMRADVGQSPRDIERAREESNAARAVYRAVRFGQPEYQDPHEGWIWLGQPGWWGPYAAGSPERVAVEAFLAGLPREAIPEGPCEWTKLSEFEPDPSDAAIWKHCMGLGIPVPTRVLRAMEGKILPRVPSLLTYGPPEDELAEEREGR